MTLQTTEAHTAKYLSNWISYKTLTEQSEESPRARILGRLEGVMQAGIVVSNEDLTRILQEYQFSINEVRDLMRAQLAGIRKGADLGYNDKKEFWEAHGERIGNLPLMLEYKPLGEQNE